ncbi:hypothetical protein ASG87_11355 [Frateuria sp. Soil773]|uniref:lysozyme inhibitor LprI family protein n=1 Tax=Frateuria sp. Soil773 TaxID=1736407 RepID=UPI0006FF10A4|nr:hypothetical protein [Frateuria sp. Soil773]KRF02074.1 hypothetical protein ASG87_11355 [Frateuria sp. Soil773]
MRRLPALLLLALPLLAHAAGFDCRKAAGAAEKTICADATLSKLDAELSGAWQKARAVAADPAAATRRQRAWLALRDACGDNKECLRSAYRERLQALQATADAGGFRWQQEWQRESANRSVGSQLVLSGELPALHFVLSAWNGANTGVLEGDLALRDGVASYRNGSGCRLDVRRHGDGLRVDQHGDSGGCGAGMGVDYAGDYRPAAEQAGRPAADLLSLGVLDTPAQNEAARALLGKDYDTLVDDVNMQGEVDDLDGLGAAVGSYFVRGIANTNAAIVMRKDAELWIGLLVFDAGNALRMRYYTNVPAWKDRIPKTIQAWHDNNDKSIPIDRMP